MPRVANSPPILLRNLLRYSFGTSAPPFASIDRMPLVWSYSNAMTRRSVSAFVNAEETIRLRSASAGRTANSILGAELAVLGHDPIDQPVGDIDHWNVVCH